MLEEERNTFQMLDVHLGYEADLLTTDLNQSEGGQVGKELMKAELLSQMNLCYEVKGFTFIKLSTPVQGSHRKNVSLVCSIWNPCQTFVPAGASCPPACYVMSVHTITIYTPLGTKSCY